MRGTVGDIRLGLHISISTAAVSDLRLVITGDGLWRSFVWLREIKRSCLQ